MSSSVLFKKIQYIYLFGMPCSMWDVLAPQPGIKPKSSAVNAWHPNHWAIREFPFIYLKIKKTHFIHFFFYKKKTLWLCGDGY